ncbi:hypothetical protein J3459_022303 [Metarhizium acridum]|nr:hypothetical protein J3459_022303 [Metarhizium acridum]
MGDYSMVEKISRNAVNKMEKILCIAHPEIIMSVLLLTAVLYLQKNFEESELMLERASDLIFEGFTESYIPRSEILTKSATELDRQEKYEAKNKNQQPLNDDELDCFSIVEVLLLLIDGLSVSPGYRGMKTRTEKLKRLCVDTFEKLLCEEYCDRLVQLDILATGLNGQGKYEEAEQINWRLIDGFKMSLNGKRVSVKL